jgi:AcrR family transcriptional regulator
MTTAVRRTKAEQREATSRDLVRVARQLFAAEGYAQTATEEIVRRAGLTRGALYHHFGSKQGLFIAVLASVQRDIARAVAQAASEHADPWDRLRAGCHAFLRAALDPDVQQIALVDAPAVLGWDTWRASDAAHSQRLLQHALRELAEAGLLSVASPEAAAFLLSGAMNEAALWIARADPVEPAVAAAIDALDHMLDGLRAQSVNVSDTP